MKPKTEAPIHFTHEINSDEVYYLTGPQQQWPPEGEFKAGTKVLLVQDSGSYSKVTSEDGITAYVATGSLTPLEKPAS